MAGGNWNPGALPIRPGLYANFVEQADLSIKQGARGTVAMAVKVKGGTLEVGKFGKVDRVSLADELVGEEAKAPVVRALEGGAMNVLVYGMGQDDTYENVFKAMATQYFDVLVFAEKVPTATQEEAVTFCQESREHEGKRFILVLGAGSDEDDNNLTVGNARSIRVKDEDVVNVINSVEGLGTVEQAQIIAGMIAGTAINDSITYDVVEGTDLVLRLTHTETVTALESGSLVLTHDGEKIKVEQGITTGKDVDGNACKIRPIRARHAILADLMKVAHDKYIGKLPNNADGQATLISAMMAYLERLENQNVLSAPKVILDPNNKSIGDQVFLIVSYVEIDSMERIFLTINI